jgi:hypothetical protein
MLTTAERQAKLDKIDVLLLAKGLLRRDHNCYRVYFADGSLYYLCNALQEAAGQQPQYLTAAVGLQDYIHVALGGASTLERWLGILGTKCDGFFVMMLGYQTRKAWVDWMINCLLEDLAK